MISWNPVTPDDHVITYSTSVHRGIFARIEQTTIKGAKSGQTNTWILAFTWDEKVCAVFCYVFLCKKCRLNCFLISHFSVLPMYFLFAMI